MRIVRRPRPLAPALTGGVVAIGNFDGVHLGHQAIVAAARALAAPERRPVVALTFEPHPRTIFRPQDPPFRLTPLREKARLLARLGVDALYAIPFSRDFAAQPAEHFILTTLVEDLRAHGVVVGEDFCFGRNRVGDARFLHAQGAAAGFTVTVAPHLTRPDGTSYSSTLVRALLCAGAPDQAAEILDRPFHLSGRVRRGAQLGRTIGFPTANLALGTLLRPRLGVYAIRATMPDGAGVDGVANIGRRPTVAGGAEERLEAHLFDWSGDLYGRRLEIELIEFIRDERRFDGLPALQAQIALDVAAARRALAATSP